MSDHLNDLLKRLPQLESCRRDITLAMEVICRCYENSGKLLLCGNGGSAADAEHWAGELLKGFQSKRPLSAKQKGKLPPALADKLQGALAAIPLTGFISLSTAFCNDVDPQLVFAQLVYALGNPGDVLVGISTSGDAKNVYLAAQAAAAKGMVTIALTGQSGGKLRSLADVCIAVPHDRTCMVQELHLPIYHTLCMMLEERFFGG